MAKQSKVGEGYQVASPFRDKDNWDTSFEVGQDVSDLPKERLDHLVSLGLVVEGKAKAED